MKVKPMIADYEVPGIQRIGTLENRNLVKIPVPGLEGSYHQDLGQASLAICIEGTLAGDEARDAFLEKLRDKFKAGEPVDFVADITTATETNQVLILDMKMHEVAGSTDSFRYRLTLAKYVEPPSTAPGADLGFGDLADLEAGLDLEALGIFDALQIPDLLGSIPDFGNPVPPLTSSLDQFKTVTAGLSDTMSGLRSLFGISE
jgi:hypothetical protein